MPTRPAPFCRGNNRRCPNKATHNGLCKAHHDEAEREYDAKRPDATARGYDAKWRETRRQYLHDHPWCEGDECSAKPQWLRAPAQEVDHRDGLGPLGPRGHDPANLRALCKPCHSKRTARDQPGGWNRRATRAGGVAKDDEFYL
jgi:5-methylcytosine-specific restriction protein A